MDRSCDVTANLAFEHTSASHGRPVRDINAALKKYISRRLSLFTSIMHVAGRRFEQWSHRDRWGGAGSGMLPFCRGRTRRIMQSPVGIAYERWPMIEIVSLAFMIGSVVVLGRLLCQAFDE